MNARLMAVEAKRARLLERAATQRKTVAEALQQWARPVGLVDRAIAALNIVKSHPLLVAGAMIVLTVLRPRGAFRWARRGWSLWQTFRWLTKKVAV